MQSDSKMNILQQLSQENKFDYLDNNNDCLTDAFITIYESSLWCIKFFIKSLWQILLFTKEELHYNQHDNINSIDILSINNSAGENYSKKIDRQLPRYHSSMVQKNNQRQSHHRLRKTNSQQSRFSQETLSKINRFPNKTPVTLGSLSNQNLNQRKSNHTSLTIDKNLSNTLGTINSHIIVTPIKSSHCQNLISKNNLKQSENVNLREQLMNELCLRSYEPLTFINRGMCCGHCRPLFFSNILFHHSDHFVPTMIPQQETNQEKELSQKPKHSSQMSSHNSQTQSTTPHSNSPNIQSQLTDSREDEPLSTNNISKNGTNKQNHSVLSFPEHDTPQSQQSEELIDDDSQLKLNAQILVDDSIQNAQEKYQQILRMNTNQSLRNNTLATVKQIIKNQSKSAAISDKSDIEKISNDNRLCQELCNKLNLSDSNQISEIIRILASNAPHILKEQPSNKPSLTDHSTINIDNEDTLCNQLLLHPPFKPKRLIHLCPDGSIQVLSAIDENSDKNNIINQQQYHLNYSNSAIASSIQPNHILTNDSSLALVDLENNFNHMMFTESTSTQQSHSKNRIFFNHLTMDNNNSIISHQPQNTLFKYNNPFPLAKDNQHNSDHAETISQDDDLIVKINLDLNDEKLEENSEDDENSLPEIFFKRIIAPENSITSLTDGKNEMFNICHKNHQKSRHNHSRSYANQKAINIKR